MPSAVTAVADVLTSEGFVLAVVLADGQYVETEWQLRPDRLVQARVRLRDTQMGLALALHVELASPLDDATVRTPDDIVLERDDRQWVVRKDLRAEAQAEESRLGALIRERWQALQRARSTP